MLRTTLFVSVAALLSAPLVAQNQFLFPYGTPLNASNGSITTVTLGHSFTMPGGTVVTEVDVDANGRVYPVGSETVTDSSETVSELLNDPFPTIAIRWDLNDVQETPDSDIYFYTDATVSAITWVESVLGVGTIPSYGQIQLWADGRIVLVYDSQVDNDDGIAGVSPGNGAADPGSTDLSSSIGAPIITASPVVYEDWGFSAGVDDMDLQSTAIEFVPTGPGGSGGWTVIGNGGVLDAPLFARNSDVGGGCSDVVGPGTTFLYIPDGSGGYDVATTSPTLFDPAIGSDTGIASDDGVSSPGGTGYDLGFAMPFPDGSSYQFVDICPNGRIVPTVFNPTTDLSPSVLDIEGDGWPFFFCWTDFNVNEPTSDAIYLNTGPGFATVTWNNVSQFGANEVPLTTQIQMFEDGSVYITLENIAGFNAPGFSSPDDLAVGVSDGTTSGTEIDFSSIAGTLNVSPCGYEYWDASAGLEPVDFLPSLLVDNSDQPVLAALTTPKFGSSWALQVQSLPVNGGTLAVGGFVLIDFGGVDVPLDPIVPGCSLQVPLAPIAAVLGGLPGSNSQVYTLAIPTDVANFGLTIFAQGGSDGNPNSPLGVYLVNSISGSLGF